MCHNRLDETSDTTRYLRKKQNAMIDVMKSSKKIRMGTNSEKRSTLPN